MTLCDETASASLRWGGGRLMGWRGRRQVDVDSESGSCSHGLRTALSPQVSGPRPSLQNCTWTRGVAEQPGRCHKECVASALAPEGRGSIQPHLPLWSHCLPSPHPPRCPWWTQAWGLSPGTQLCLPWPQRQVPFGQGWSRPPPSLLLSGK